MKTPLLISLALIIVAQISLGYTEETAAAEGSDKQAAVDTDTPSLSRAKRGGYDMMRLARGLHMLRLGKRDGGVSPDDEELLNFLQEYYQQFPEEPIYLDNDEVIYPDSEMDVPAHPRFRRSAPGPEGVVPPPQLQEDSSDLKDNEESEVKVEGDEEPYLLYPEDDTYMYGDLDDLYQSLGNGEVEDNENVDDVELGKRQLSMLRLGKRSLGMLRLGKREDEEAEKRQLSMLRLGKRSLGMLRLGKRDFDEEEEKRNLGMLRLGKRPMSMLRLGKRPMSMLRLGKRPMSMLRLGKRPMSMLRLGKRPMSMLRLGKRPMSMLRLGKRPMSMLRLGKRPMSMLRLGKRPMSMLRLGKRPMSMLRLGKRQDEDLNESFNEEEKRSLGMLRLGKRPMSMLRLGKRPMSMLRLGKREDEGEEKRSLGMLRLGKRSAE